MKDNRYFKHMNWEHCQMDTCDKKEDKYYCEFEKKCYYVVDKEHKEKSCCHKHDECKCKHKQHKCDCKEEKHCCEDKRDEWKDKHHDCKGCICHLLKRFELGTRVDVYLSGGGRFLDVVFIKLDECNCCAYFVEPGAATEPIIIDCQKIDAVRRIAAA